jgi:hypothetical protein
LAKSSLIVGENFEMLYEWPVEDVGLLPKITSTAPNKEESWTRTMDFIVDVEFANAEMGHDGVTLDLNGRRPFNLTAFQ